MFRIPKNNIFKTVLVVLVFVCALYPALATAQITIDGAFDGCDYDKTYKLTNGMLLICHSYGYHYAYRPDVTMLDNGDVIIDNEKYAADIVSGEIIETRVDGEFNGCEFDKTIPLSNGLLFQCQTYYYHYAYSPKVEISIIGGAQKILIDGKEYKGKIIRK